MHAAILLAALSLSGQPNVLIIGDSISLGYTPYVEQQLAGKANVFHSPGNAQGTRNALRPQPQGGTLLDTWLADDFYDVIYWNFGIHDMRRDVGPYSPLRWGEPEVYSANLRTIARRLEQTGSSLVFATSTPLIEGNPNVKAGDELLYNDIARGIMADEGVPLSDLYYWVFPNADEWQIGNGNLHYTDAGYQGIAEKVSFDIAQALPIPGDANGDGRADLSDFGTLKANFGTTGNRLQGDLNWDRSIDLSDFGVLKANFGGARAVPEPSAWVLAALAALLLASPPRRARMPGAQGRNSFKTHQKTRT